MTSQLSQLEKTIIYGGYWNFSNGASTFLLLHSPQSYQGKYGWQVFLSFINLDALQLSMMATQAKEFAWLNLVVLLAAEVERL